MKKFNINIYNEFEKDFYTIKELKSTTDKNLYIFFNLLKQDKYYYNLYKKTKSINFLYKSGFFLDGFQNIKEQYYENIFSTPFNKLDLDKNKINYIVLTTGAFAPIHNGHLNLIDKSIDYLKSLNKHVAGAYISPSHDDYVLNKPNQLDIMNSFYRISEINKLIFNHKYLMCDNWESNIAKSSVNFTQVIYRLEKYLSYHFKKYKFEIVFVYGADNIDFKNVFEVNKKISICINRNEKIDFNQDFKNKYTVFLDNKNNISSTEIRKEYNFLLLREKENINKNMNYYLRNDSKKILGYDIEENIREIFSKYISYNLKIVATDDEIFVKEKNELIINLDYYYNGDYNLNFSRLFNLCDGQIKSKKLILRPRQKNNIKEIPDGVYTLVDDDVCTGQTIKNIIKMLPKRIKINKVKQILDTENCIDVNDVRDFILGSKNGGLVVSLPNKKKVRVPYIFPYISCNNRFLIDLKDEKKISLDILNLNYLLLKEKKLKDMDVLFINLMLSQGFNKNDDMTYIINYLKKMIKGD